MGKIYQAECPKCHYKKEFHLGSGLGSLQLQQNLTGLPKKEQDEIVSLEKQEMIESFQMENMLAGCKYCNKLQEKMMITIIAKNGMSHRYGAHCDECSRKLTVYKLQDEERVLCPCCQEAVLDFHSVGRWD